MFNDLPPLASLRAFEAAVWLGAFNLAAEELNVTPAAVGAQAARRNPRFRASHDSGLRPFRDRGSTRENRPFAG